MNNTTQNSDDSGIGNARSKGKQTIVTNRMRFHPGQNILATPGALALMSEHGVEPLQLLTRFVHGDWGDVPHDDAALNEQALHDGSRLMGVYILATKEMLEATPKDQKKDLPQIWLICDATSSDKDDPRERNVTTFLRSQDY